jgi:DNA-binding transcriptional regulator GbsR (MarR family)
MISALQWISKGKAQEFPTKTQLSEEEYERISQHLKLQINDNEIQTFQDDNAEDIAEALGFSRSNVSMGLKELDSWQLIRLKHLPNDRRDYFTTPEDIWEIVRTLVEERRKREIEPTLSMLRDVMLENPSSAEEKHAQAKMREMHDLIEMLTGWYHDMQRMDTDRLVNLLKLGSKVYKLYEMKDKIKLIPGGKDKKEKR